MRLFTRAPLLGVVIPAWGVEDYLDDCIRSLLAQTHTRWEAVIVDDGSVDRTGEIADDWARRDVRITRRPHRQRRPRRRPQPRCRAGARRLPRLPRLRRRAATHGVRRPRAALSRTRGPTSPPARSCAGRTARSPSRRGCDDSTSRCAGRGSSSGPSCSATSSPGTSCGDGPSGTQRAWRGPRACATRTSRRRRGPSLPAPSTWSTRSSTTGGSARGRSPRPAPRCEDLRDRWETKRSALASVRAHGAAEVEEVFVDRVLAGDLWRYFLLVPGASEEWWRLLRGGVLEFWGQRSLVHSGLPPVHRLAGWLVEQDRRADVHALMEWVGTLDGPAPRAQDIATGAWRLAVPPRCSTRAAWIRQALALRRPRGVSRSPARCNAGLLLVPPLPEHR